MIFTMANNMNKLSLFRRSIISTSFLFANIDELWLYHYHGRNYGNMTKTIFEVINFIEKEKW